MSDEYITTEDYINANRSPPLRPTQINYRSTETPPPSADSDTVDDESVQVTKTVGEGCATSASNPARPSLRPSLSDLLLLRYLGPNYPEVALIAAKEPLTNSPELPWEDRKPDLASTEKQLVYDYTGDANRTQVDTKMLAVAAFEASQKLNAAIEKDRTMMTLPSSSRMAMVHQDERMGSRTESSHFRNEGYRHLLDHRQYIGSEELSLFHTSKPFNVKPPPRTCLPPIKTNSPTREAAIPPSAALAKFAIAPVDHNSDQHLPRMRATSTTLADGIIIPSKQTLPSLETALSALSTPSESIYSGRSPPLIRPSPGQLSHLGPSPSTYSNVTSPASGISPPRVSSTPAYWRTVSRETSDSTPSEYASVAPSVGISTPASSAPAHSPSESAQTPSTVIHEIDAQHMNHSLTPGSMSGTPSEIDAQYTGSYCGGSFKCTWPGCNAAPFQTQYLLNSHANVHSNTRPHFCPVQGCPRGPDGQGFKRKNEMIRHGLVHQSPGYVCPFCPDQQHKYPRPDNLQRHVRVHHVDRDRDDPQLRDVLAQRPEGGNRGRRRRLGS